MSSDNLKFLQKLQFEQQSGWTKNYSTSKSIDWLIGLINIFFPEEVADMDVTSKSWQSSQEQFCNLIKNNYQSETADADYTVNALYNILPNIYDALQKDASALLKNDPAASDLHEVLNSYPGFFAIVIYRFAKAIAGLSIKNLPRILTEYAHTKTGIDIHPTAQIDTPFVIDHGTGTVIGATAIVGKNVHLYQGVTLGALWVEKKLELSKRHPTVEHNVVIYANATILGGSTVIGNNSIIGGNTFITKSVNPYSQVQQSSNNIIINRLERPETDSFTI